MRTTVAAASLLVPAAADSRTMFAPVPPTTANSGLTSAEQMYRPALAPVEYAQYLSEPLGASVQPVYVQPTYEEEGSWTPWACAAACALLAGAVATRRPNGAVLEPDLEAARVAAPARLAALAVEGADPTASSEGPAPTSSGRPFGYPAVWNPQNLDVPKLPDIPGAKLFEQQFVPEYLKSSPPYLTDELAGDIGFDPWCLVALAKPTKENAMQYDKNLRTAEARKQKMLSMSPEEQAESVAWMRTAEIKHARLAMLAAAGWPLAELANSGGGSALRFATNGRAPSLFNGHLLDYFPALFVIFGGLAYLEAGLPSTHKGGFGGDFGFDPLGISSGKGPVEKIANIEKFPGYKHVGNKEALELAELKNGRAAMMAITGFAVAEVFWGKPVTELTPIFF